MYHDLGSSEFHFILDVFIYDIVCRNTILIITRCSFARVILMTLYMLYYIGPLHTYHSRSIPEDVAEASQIFLQDAHVLPILLSYEEDYRRDRW
jgi:hypothetical protein